MNKTPLLIFLALLVASAVWAGLLLYKTPTRFSPSNELIGKKLVERFTTEDVAEVRIADDENEVVLKRDGDKWVVPSRGNFPIDSEKELQRLVASILALQVGLEIPAEDKHYALMHLLSPDEKERAEKFKAAEKEKGEEDPPDPTGILVSLKGPDGSELVKLVLGEEFGGDPEQPRRGIVVRSMTGNEGAWKVLGDINRRTGELGGTDVRRGPIAEPKSWLEYDFVEVEKIQSITLSAPNDEEFTGWTVKRESEDGDFTMDGLAEDEELDSGSASTFKTLFSSLRFEDILDPDKLDGRTEPKEARRAVIKTFDGFTYTFDLVPLKPEEEEKEEGEDDDSPPPPPGNFAGSIKVEGEFKETRDKVEGETEERAKAEDEAYAVRLENLKDKLARQKAYEGRTYEFARFTMTSLLKNRDELAKKKEEEKPDDANKTGVVPPAGSRPTAVTPPVRVPPFTPPVEEEE